MTPYRLLLLFFGIPLSVLTMGLRRAIGARAMALIFLGANAVALYAVGMETLLHHFGLAFPLPSMQVDGFHASRDLFRLVGPIAVAGAWLGTLGCVLVRTRRKGETE